MPYTLDLIRHRDQFRRRGLKPVHNPETQPQDHGRDDDAQYQADEEEDIALDKEERYVPPKDVPKDGEERASKRRKIQAEKERGDVVVRKKIGKNWIDPRKFDVSRGEKVAPKEQRQVSLERAQEMDYEEQVSTHFVLNLTLGLRLRLPFPRRNGIFAPSFSANRTATSAF